MSNVRVFATTLMQVRAAAEHFVRVAEVAITTRGRFVVALSGGQTPRGLFSLLAEEYSQYIEWSLVHIFWGDERCVPPTHSDSNYRMARETFLSFLMIPAGNVHRMRGEIDPKQAAEEYEQLLRGFFARDDEAPKARFDLMMLGMGEDGHTASLFPHSEALHELARWVVSVNVADKEDAWRVTLTPIAINDASNVLFLVNGSKKAEALYSVLKGPYQPDVFPAQIVKPENGQVWWMVDREAGAKLEGS